MFSRQKDRVVVRGTLQRIEYEIAVVGRVSFLIVPNSASFESACEQYMMA